MAANCPHCNETIEALSGFVDEATLRARLKSQGSAKDGEIAALRTKVEEQNTTLSETAGAAAELAALKAAVESRNQRDTRLGALTEAKIDASLLDSIEVLYQSATAGQGDGAKDFPTWLKEDAAAHPLLSPHIGAGGAGTGSAGDGGADGAAGAGGVAEGAGAGTGEGVSLLGNTDTAAGTPPGPNTGKIKPEDVAAYFQTPEFRGLSSKDRRAKIAELKVKVSSQH